MDLHTLFNCLLIFAGALIMLICIISTKGVKKALHLVPERQRSHITRNLVLHRVLMAFFVCGYFVVLAAFIFHYSFISETFVSLIFFFGAIFVFIGVSVQSRLITEVQNTLQGILPICCKCKKIRNVDADQKDPQAWKKIEDFLLENTDVNFSHGFCPECFEVEKQELNKMGYKL